MSRHQGERLPWRGIRRRYSRLRAEYDRLFRAHHHLKQEYQSLSEELERLRDKYEPQIPEYLDRPYQTSWGRANEMAMATEQADTTKIPVITSLGDQFHNGMTEPVAFDLRDRYGLLVTPGGTWHGTP